MKSIFKIFTQYKGLSKSAYVLFIARLVTSMGGFIWPLLTLILSRKIGYSPSTIALVSIGVGLLYMPASVIGGKLADKYDKRKIIIILDSLSFIFFISCSLIKPSNLMTALFILAGLFANMEGPSFEALIAESTKPDEREKVYSLSYLGGNLGLIFGAAIGGLLFENYLNLAFLLDGITTISSTILIVIFVKTIKKSDLKLEERNEYEDHVHEDEKTFEILIKRKPVFVQLLVFLLGALIYDQWSFAIPLYLEELFKGDGARYFGILASFNGLIVIIFTPITTKLLENVKEIPKIIIGILLYSFSYLIIRDTALYLTFFIMMTAFTIGEIVNMLGSAAYISKRIPASHLGRVNSVRFIGTFIGAVTGRLIMGILIDKFSYSVAFSFLGMLGIVVAIIAYLNYRLDKSMFPKLYSELHTPPKE